MEEGMDLRRVPELLGAGFALACNWWFWSRLAGRAHGVAAAGLRLLWWLSSLGLAIAAVYALPLVRHVTGQPAWLEWMRAMSLSWALWVVIWWVADTVLRAAWRRPATLDPGRRRLLSASATLAASAPAAGVAFGILVGRNGIQLTEVEAPIPGLPRELDGLRLVQLSDIHLGAYLAPSELRRAVELANATRAHLAMVTGDLITFRDDYLSACLHELARLRAESGVFGCLGNHEQTARCEQRTKQEGARLGIRFLRRESVRLRFGSATLNLSGVDFRRRRTEYAAEIRTLFQPGEVNVLLSHNPEAFPAAAGQGYQLTLAGHTHGGQLTLPGFDRHLNAARLFTPFVYGLYRQGASLLFVSRGIGTVVVPARLGAPPEVALIRLCAT